MAYFENISNIKFEGPASKNPFAFKYYNPEEVVGGKTMEELLRFSVAYWHTFTCRWNRSIWCSEHAIRPWNKYTGMDLAKARVEAAFELFEKLNVPFFASMIEILLQKEVH